MNEQLLEHPFLVRLSKLQDKLSSKGKLLSEYIQANPKQVVFMTIKELSRACAVSEATVVRFVRQLGYSGYNQFLRDLRDLVDTGITLLDRVDISKLDRPEKNRLQQTVSEGISNLKHLYNYIDLNNLEQMLQKLQSSQAIYVVGSRLSYALAYYLGWGLTKVRHNIHILKGSDSACLDWLVNAPQKSLVLIITTTRYPNELIKLGKTAKRLEHELLLLADSSLCPLISFADLSLVVPSKNIPFFGDITILSCIIRYIILELLSRSGQNLQEYQERLEQIYLENDILFNIGR